MSPKFERVALIGDCLLFLTNPGFSQNARRDEAKKAKQTLPAIPDRWELTKKHTKRTKTDGLFVTFVRFVVNVQVRGMSICWPTYEPLLSCHLSQRASLQQLASQSWRHPA